MFTTFYFLVWSSPLKINLSVYWFTHNPATLQPFRILYYICFSNLVSTPYVLNLQVFLWTSKPQDVTDVTWALGKIGSWISRDGLSPISRFKVCLSSNQNSDNIIQNILQLLSQQFQYHNICIIAKFTLLSCLRYIFKACGGFIIIIILLWYFICLLIFVCFAENEKVKQTQ